MQNSNFWQDMFIPHNANEIGEHIVSTELPLAYDDKYKLDIDTNVDMDSFLSFLQHENCMASGNTTLMTTEQYQHYQRLKAYIYALRAGKNKRIVGTILSLPLPIKSSKMHVQVDKTSAYLQSLLNDNPNVIIHGCTTHLCIAKALRGSGLCMALIRKLIQDGHKAGIYCGYYTTADKIAANGIQIESWFRPIKLKTCRDAGFIYPSRRLAKDRSDFRDRAAFTVNKPSAINIIKADMDSWLIYKELADNKKFVFYPNVYFWQKWLAEYPTYFVYKKQKCIGMFSQTTISSHITVTDTNIELAFPLLCLSLKPEFTADILKAFLYISRNYPLIYLYQAGDITETVLQSINALKTTAKIWFGLYNNAIELNNSDIHVPLL